MDFQMLNLKRELFFSFQKFAVIFRLLEEKLNNIVNFCCHMKLSHRLWIVITIILLYIAIATLNCQKTAKINFLNSTWKFYLLLYFYEK